MADPKMHVSIVTPYSLFFEGDVEMVVLTAIDGEIGIQPGHTPLIAALLPGEIRLRQENTWHILSSTRGYAEIGPDQILVVVTAAEWPDQIDVARARMALNRAQQRLADPATPEQEILRSRFSVLRAKARLKVVDKVAADPALASRPVSGSTNPVSPRP